MIAIIAFDAHNKRICSPKSGIFKAFADSSGGSGEAAERDGKEMARRNGKRKNEAQITEQCAPSERQTENRHKIIIKH